MGIEVKTIGELIDQLTIENIRLWMMHEPGAKGMTLEKVKAVNKRRNALISAIDKRLGDGEFTKTGKTY